MRRRLPSRTLLTVAIAGLPLPALAQSISTLPPNNGSGGVFLQLTPTGSNLTVESFATYFSSVAGTPVSVEVWVRPGAYAGFTASNVGWTLSETVVGTSAGTTTLSSTINLANPIAIPAGGPTSIYLHAITAGGGIRYQGTGTTATTTFSNADVTLFSDISRTGAVSFGGTQFTPRAFSGTINYSIGGITGRCCRTDGTCVVTSAANCANQGGTYGGDGTNCSPNPCPQPPSGACCFEAGTCSVLTAANCAAQGGTYSGDGTACASANCPQPGACCLPDGSCVILTSAKCTAATTGGTYRGDGTTCGAVSPRCWSSSTLWKNGPLSTGATAQSGLAAPSGATWSEVSNNTGQTTVANTTAGYSALAPIRNADNFTITDAGGWQVDKVILPTYQTGSTTVPTITGATLQIWNGRPGDAGSSVVFGDTVTNRMSSVVFSDIYRCFNSIVPPTCGGAATVPDTTRPIMLAELDVNTVLPPGTYWLDWSLSGSLASGPWSPPTTIRGLRAASLANNGRQFNAAWVDTADAGQGCTPTAVIQDFAFEIRGSALGGGCYANCDQSTGTPLLTANDFQCFLNKYAANDTYANCDGSTGTPLLTANDFQCFLNKFAAGCT
ncbi:MAG: hypothetical protein KF678_03650 [Phycisphaeraceae bacterium]|nr:hypothetical protein [Phycisphaeraceae bacterium]